MTYKVISARGVKIYPSEEAYHKARAEEQISRKKAEEAAKVRRHAVDRTGRIMRTEEEIQSAYASSQLTLEEMEEGLNQLYGLPSGTT